MRSHYEILIDIYICSNFSQSKLIFTRSESGLELAVNTIVFVYKLKYFNFSYCLQMKV